MQSSLLRFTYPVIAICQCELAFCVSQGKEALSSQGFNPYFKSYARNLEQELEEFRFRFSKALPGIAVLMRGIAAPAECRERFRNITTIETERNAKPHINISDHRVQFLIKGANLIECPPINQDRTARNVVPFAEQPEALLVSAQKPISPPSSPQTSLSWTNRLIPCCSDKTQSPALVEEVDSTLQKFGPPEVVVWQ
jgi:hypothetical protein